MKALFLAAGFSTRLSPLTNELPKGLLSVHGKPIISALLNQVVNQPELEEVALITNAKDYPHYHEFLRGQSAYKKISIIDNGVERVEERLGAIGDLSLALDLLEWEDDVLVLPSDTLVSIDLTQLLTFYHKYQSFVNVVYEAGSKDAIRNKLGCAVVAGDKLVDFVEKPANPPTTLQSVPIYLYPAHTLPLIAEYEATGQNLDSPGAIIPWLISQTDCYAYQVQQGFYFDVGTVEMYEAINQDPLIFS